MILCNIILEDLILIHIFIEHPMGYYISQFYTRALSKENLLLKTIRTRAYLGPTTNMLSLLNIRT